ncbi:hypothetical protein BYT27DRAFT_7108525 [Phlegmacium glaucopus]|nr:hypothetical protein BYT27DRAFT_7108525 [Phlegmacium glaucopus]
MSPNLYPPSHEAVYHGLPNPSETAVGEDSRLPRTPSPTPSEAKELESGAVSWKSLSTRKFWFRRAWLWYYVALVIVLVVSVLLVIYHTQIVNWLTPATKWLHGLKAGWLVPIGILFVISFPPLFGHEIVAVLCGLVWGLWIGFAIVAAGTFLGEVGNFYAFKYCCRSRGEKLEKTKIWYACLAKVVRDGGFKIALIARLSAIPGHFTTAVFSTCGMGIIVFSFAAILSMPKQFITVYLGVILEQSNTGVQDTKSRIISDVVIALTLIITIVAMWYILHQMNKVKPQVIYEKRKARQAKLLRAEHSPYSNEEFSSSSTDVFHPNASDLDIPLTIKGDGHYQQWDRHGKAVGYAADPSIIHTPKPQVANATFLPLTHPRDVEEAGNLTSKRGRQESTDVVGWHLFPHGNQVSDPYAPDSFTQVTSPSMMNPHPLNQHPDVQQTTTQSNFVNGPAPTNTIHPRFDEVYGSTTSFRTALSSPHQEHDETFHPPNYPPPGQQATSQPEFSQPPASYMTDLR